MFQERINYIPRKREDSSQPEKLVITRMKCSHIDRVREIEKMVFSEPWSKEAFTKELSHSCSFVVECNGVCVGFTMIRIEGSAEHISRIDIFTVFFTFESIMMKRIVII
jgi:hypothetical protein